MNIWSSYAHTKITLLGLDPLIFRKFLDIHRCLKDLKDPRDKGLQMCPKMWDLHGFTRFTSITFKNSGTIVLINIKFRVVIFHVLTKKKMGLGHSVGRVLFCWAPGSCEK